MPVDDESLMEMVKSGDHLAFEQLCNRYRSKLSGYIQRIGIEKEATQDIVQIVFLRVWEKRTSFTSSKFSTWLYTIAHNAAIDELRKHYHRTLLFSELQDGSQTDDAGESGETVKLPAKEDVSPDVTKLIKQLQKNLVRLPPQQRTAFILRVLKNQPYEEISGQLGCSEAMARQLVCRARKTLKKTPKLLALSKLRHTRSFLIPIGKRSKCNMTSNLPASL